MLPPLSLTGHAAPPVRFPVGLLSLLFAAIHHLSVGLDLNVPQGFVYPFGRAL